MKIGYARCSTVEQDLERQVAALTGQYGVDPDRVYVDHGFSGKTMTREGFERARAALREGDEFVVPAMDRLARNASESLAFMQELTAAGVTMNIGGVVYNPHDPMSKLFITILAAVAEAEGGWVSLRTKEAMARPKVRARLKGKPAKLNLRQDAAVAQHLADGHMTPGEIATMFNVSRASIYRAAARHQARASERVD